MKNDRPNCGFLHRHPGMEVNRKIKDNHVIVDIEDWEKARRFPEMLEALKEIKKIAKRLNYWIGIDTIINPLINEIES